MSDFFNSDAFFILALGVVFFLCILLLVILLKPKKHKVCTVQATITAKKIKRVYVKSLANAGVSGTDWLEYYAVFETEKGKKTELQLKREIYESLNEGDKGQLTFSGYNFISFEKNSCFFVDSTDS